MAAHAASGRTMDSEYFAAVDHFLQRQEELPAAIDRREDQRFSYPAKAMIAFCREDQIPPINWFQSVMCRDISRSGFSFFYSDLPKQEHLIVIFRLSDDYLSLFCEVMESYVAEEDEESAYAVGCRFVKKVEAVR